MNNDFCRIITLLRKEKKLSQKKVASDLGISQALLSHYEKGIRECGLDFLVSVADYYDVSCDYLLGRTPDRYSDISDFAEDATTRSKKNASTQVINKRLIQNTMGVIYDYVIKIGNRRLSNTVSNYLMIAVYNIFRKIYSANSSNPQDMFAISHRKYSGYSSGSMQMLAADIDIMTDRNEAEYIKALDDINISPDTLANEYPQTASSVFNLIQHAESSIKAKR